MMPAELDALSPCCRTPLFILFHPPDVRRDELAPTPLPALRKAEQHIENCCARSFDNSLLCLIFARM